MLPFPLPAIHTYTHQKGYEKVYYSHYKVFWGKQYRFLSLSKFIWESKERRLARGCYCSWVVELADTCWFESLAGACQMWELRLFYQLSLMRGKRKKEEWGLKDISSQISKNGVRLFITKDFIVILKLRSVSSLTLFFLIFKIVFKTVLVFFLFWC